jgi:hypothetical protein
MTSEVSSSIINSHSTGPITLGSTLSTLPVSKAPPTGSGVNYVPYLIVAAAIVVSGACIEIGLAKMNRRTKLT